MTVTSGGATYTSQQVNKDGITSSYQVSLNNKTLKAVGKALSIAEKVKRTTEEYYLDDNTTPFEMVVSSTDALGRLTEIERKYDGAKKVISTYTYDSLNRVTQKVTDYIGFLLGDYITDYTYSDITSSQKTTRIASETCRFDNKELGKFEYTYYPNGNVSTVKKDGVLIREYIYDEHDRLTWEKNFATSIAYNYEYDGSGNILAKHTHTISNSTVSETPTKTQEYGYYDANPDRLYLFAVDEGQSVFVDHVFHYDALGNPTKHNGKTLEWQGRKLTKVGDTAMQYDYNGLRTRKGERYYYWLGNTLKMERWGENTIYYYYDESGVSGFRYNNTDYYYHKNIFGDVIAIYDVNGNLQCTYDYDAWGNHKVYGADGVELSASSTNMGNINPIRYRGYYWDAEFGLYYLQSRYYSPEIGRFISPADVASLNPRSINGLNLYAYANNNPIGITYSSSGAGANGGMVSSIASSVGGLNSGYHGTISNSSNILGALGTLSTAFGLFDQWSGYLSGGLDAGLAYWGPEGFGFQFLGKYSSALKKFGIGMTIAGNVLSWGSSVYNNFNNPNYSTGEAIGASFMDAAYYTGKGFGTYWLGSKVGELAVTAGIAAGSAALGATAFGTTIGFVGAFAIGGGVAVLVGIAGAVAIYYLGEWIDDGWEWLKKQIFE